MSSLPAVSMALIGFIKECERNTSLDLSSDSPSLELLTNGLSNKNYLIRTPDKSYVLRENSSQSDFVCDRDNEIACWQTAAKAKLAPELIRFSSDKRYYLSEYVHQPHVRLTDNDMRLTLLAELKQLPEPDLEITSQRQWLIYQNKIEVLFQEMSGLGQAAPLLKTEFEAWKQGYRFIESRQKQLKTWTSDITASTLSLQYSHRDLNPENLLTHNNRLICIDFEYACAAEPLYDLVSILESDSISETDKQAIAESYLSGHDGVSGDAMKAVPSMNNVYRCFSRYWALMMAGITLKRMLISDSGSELPELNRFMAYLLSFERGI